MLDPHVCDVVCAGCEWDGVRGERSCNASVAVSVRASPDFPFQTTGTGFTWEAPMFAVSFVKLIFNHPSSSCCFGEGHRSRAGGQFVFPFALLSGNLSAVACLSTAVMSSEKLFFVGIHVNGYIFREGKVRRRESCLCIMH